MDEKLNVYCIFKKMGVERSIECFLFLLLNQAEIIGHKQPHPLPLKKKKRKPPERATSNKGI
jgi:hypothetical protein